MKKLHVGTKKPYNIYISQHYAGLPVALEEAGLSEKQVCIVTDSNVAPLYLEEVQSLLKNTVKPYIFPAGESSKHMRTLEELYDHFSAQKLDRKSLVVALGGGVVGDLAGFAAATYMRGIEFVQLPTTLLAQVDASVGGKTGVDFRGIKNLVGAFHQPGLVYIAMESLLTLSKTDYISGLAEVVKHGLIADRSYYDYVMEDMELLRTMDMNALTRAVEGSCRIKAAVVAEDEFESARREILNFGHCVGHAVESLSGYKLPHGHSVAIGMAAALCLSDVSEEERAAAVKLLEGLGLPTILPEHMENITADEILSLMQKDKKNQSGRLRVVLLKKLGETYTEESVPLEKLRDAVTDVIAKRYL